MSGVAIKLLMCLLLSAPAAAQTVQRQRVKPTAPADLYHARRHATELAFYSMAPAAAAPRGVLLLLPGFGGAADQVFKETALAQEASRAGLLTVVPTLNSRLYLDSTSSLFLEQVLEQVARQYPTTGRNLCIGGFSAGGQLALAYAEGLMRDTARHAWRVKAVFGVDPPTDLANFWQVGKRRIAQNCSPLLVREGQSMVETLSRTLGGSPAQFPAAYQRYSAFTSTNPTGGNLTQLAATPVRVYCEPDLAFWRQHYCATMQIEDLNAAMLRQLVECLQRQGNTQAEYIETVGKGKVRGRPFPHSWSIVDAPECATWLRTCLNQ